MEFKHFVNQLSQIRKALSVENEQFTDIHVTGNHIEYTRDTANRESIDIHDLLDVYNVEQHINTTILQNYIKGRKYSPALAILKAAGLYNEKGEKKVESVVKTPKIGDEVTTKRERKYTLIFLFIPVLIIILAIHLYSTQPLFNPEITIISLILLIINFVFFRYLGRFKKDNFQEITYTAYFTLMIFNVGIFPLFNYIKDYHERNKVEVVYTAGFRAWGSSVRFSDIKVSFYDKFGNPYSLLKSDIINKANWSQVLWTEDNKPGMQAPSKDFSADCITLTNCGIALEHNLFEKYNATSFYIDAKIELLGIDAIYKALPVSRQYHSAQFCLNIPYEIRNNRYNSIYNAFEFFFSNFTFSKLRIPGLNFDYTMAELYYLKKYTTGGYAQNVTDSITVRILGYEKKNYIEPIPIDSVVHLSAVLFNDDAAFYIIDKKSPLSLPLFNFNTKKYGAYSRTGE